ncbi:MAG: transketolase [Eubacteriales bacterium]|nr:transketolase [Eubacteriales bacterium]
MNNEVKNAINALRVLSVDQVEAANSGHPGMPMGAAPVIYELYANHMQHVPSRPDWKNRDRFVLSAGHGSALLYSLLHLYGYGELSVEDLKAFRQLDAKTPGHPEYGHTVGVEATTGPLGAGMAMAVGMAMAEKHLAARFNKPGYEIVDHHTFVMGGDGCLMEGISSEAFSLAGTLGLNKLIVLYDSNNITIEGKTDIAFTEDVSKRMEAFGFQVLHVDDANDIEAVGKAIESAKADTTRPSFIEIKSVIGYGAPAVEGNPAAHGAALGAENVAAMRKNLGWPSDVPFEVGADVYAHYKAIADENMKGFDEWSILFDRYAKAYPEEAALWQEAHRPITMADLPEDFFDLGTESAATRALGGKMIQKVKDVVPLMVGGSADLAPSNKSFMDGAGVFSKDTPEGRNIHYGVRELAMTAIANGMLLHGGLRTFAATFFVFSDYIKPMARLSSLMEIPQIFVLTHDSIGVGEDGPTHEPIEQLSMLRAMPNFNVFRPADATETAYGWALALTSQKTPTALVLSRQGLPYLTKSGEGALRGAYVLSDSEKEVPDGILLASGSEVGLAMDAQKVLREAGEDVRVVSVPCMDLFEQQDAAYKEAVLPPAVTKRISIEAGATLPWGRYVGLAGKSIGIDTFGASAPASALFKRFGLTVDNVVATYRSL